MIYKYIFETAVPKAENNETVYNAKMGIGS
jgi:hypothetical protein